MKKLDFLIAVRNGNRLDWRDESSDTAHALKDDGYIRWNGTRWEVTPIGVRHLQNIVLRTSGRRRSK